MSIEVIVNPAQVADRLTRLQPNEIVIGPTLDGSWGLTARHNGSVVHLGIREVRLGSDGRPKGEGRLYLDPIPQYDNRPLREVLAEGMPYNCVLASLPENYTVSRDPLGREQAEWTVHVTISGAGRTPFEWASNLFVVTKKGP